MSKPGLTKAPLERLESAELARQHRKERGEPEPQVVGKTGVGGHIDIGGVADFGPVDTRRGSVELLESPDEAEQHRKKRGEPEPQVVGKTGMAGHIDIGGVADYGPVDTQRGKEGL